MSERRTLRRWPAIAAVASILIATALFLLAARKPSHAPPPVLAFLTTYHPTGVSRTTRTLSDGTVADVWTYNFTCDPGPLVGELDTRGLARGITKGYGPGVSSNSTFSYTNLTTNFSVDWPPLAKVATVEFSYMATERSWSQQLWDNIRQWLHL